ncbi:MAG: 6-phosphogluconolactonase [Steroidobacteraceae bacterium]
MSKPTYHNVHEHRFPDREAVATALSGEIRTDLNEAIAVRDVASLVVSGGRTPVLFFSKLSQEPIKWDQVRVTLADERWVEPTSPDSNERLVREHLLQGAAPAAHFVGLKNPAATPEAGIDWAWRALSRVARPYDVVVLGMGNDGHFASLFPGSLGLARALDPQAKPACVAMNSLTAPHARISFNLAAILDSRRIVLHIEGEEKWAVWQRARAGGSSTELPIRALLQQKTVPVDVYWAP